MGRGRTKTGENRDGQARRTNGTAVSTPKNELQQKTICCANSRSNRVRTENELWAWETSRNEGMEEGVRDLQGSLLSYNLQLVA